MPLGTTNAWVLCPSTCHSLTYNTSDPRLIRPSMVDYNIHGWLDDGRLVRPSMVDETIHGWLDNGRLLWSSVVWPSVHGWLDDGWLIWPFMVDTIMGGCFDRPCMVDSITDGWFDHPCMVGSNDGWLIWSFMVDSIADGCFVPSMHGWLDHGRLIRLPLWFIRLLLGRGNSSLGVSIARCPAFRVSAAAKSRWKQHNNISNTTTTTDTSIY